MRTLRVSGTDRTATCTPMSHPVGFTDERGRTVTEFWVDERHVYLLGKEGSEPVFIRARGYAA